MILSFNQRLPDKLIDDMTVMMSILLRAKPEPASPDISGMVDPNLIPPYGNQMFTGQQSMFLPSTDAFIIRTGYEG